MASLIFPFLIYYLLIFVASYILVEYGHNYFYDEVTPGATVKVATGALILAGVLTWTRSNYATMFTDDIMWTALQAIAWFGVFVLIFRFQPWHGGALGLAAMLLLTGTATIVVDSMLRPRSAEQTVDRPVNKPVRRSAFGPAPTTTPAGAPAPK